MKSKEELRKVDIEEIRFENIDIDSLQQIEEVITPGWGPKECCH